MREILLTNQMYRADQLAVEHGISFSGLMEAAGYAVAHAIRTRFRKGRILVLCGPGNNGGDGYVAARHLHRWGYGVDVISPVAPSSLTGLAAEMAVLYSGQIREMGLADLKLSRYVAVVDALFGAGVNRPLETDVVALFREIAAHNLPLVAVDVPSGLHGDGDALGFVPAAQLTITFFRPKPAHLLCRDLCGEVVVAQIGIPDRVLGEIEPRLFLNGPELWGQLFPKPQLRGHKYDRGHVLAVAGLMAGAARLGARGARRAGAGLLTLLAADNLLPLISQEVGAICGTLDQLDAALANPKINACLIGCGLGRGKGAKEQVSKVLASTKPLVLDADGLSAFADDPDELFAQLHQNVVLTPHQGEFNRLFGKLSGSSLEQVQMAARKSGAVVLLKGAETIIAHPNGRTIINVADAPYLATAGSGDVLAGIIAGLMAQGMKAQDAACAGAWMHGQAGAKLGAGLIAEDLPEYLPAIIQELVRT